MEDIDAGLNMIARKCREGHSYLWWPDGEVERWVLDGVDVEEHVVYLYLGKSDGRRKTISIPKSDRQTLQLFVEEIQY